MAVSLRVRKTIQVSSARSEPTFVGAGQVRQSLSIWTKQAARDQADGLDTMMAEVRKGRLNVVAVYKLDRLGRSLQHLAQLIGELETRGTALVASSQGIDTSDSNPAGRLQMHVLAAVAEFERSVIVERIHAGLAAARERGAKLGRPRTLDHHISAVAKLSRRGLSGREIAAKLNIPAGSVFALLKRARTA